jgi:hypothetical protein
MNLMMYLVRTIGGQIGRFVRQMGNLEERRIFVVLVDRQVRVWVAFGVMLSCEGGVIVMS